MIEWIARRGGLAGCSPRRGEKKRFKQVLGRLTRLRFGYLGSSAGRERFPEPLVVLTHFCPVVLSPDARLCMDRCSLGGPGFCGRTIRGPESHSSGNGRGVDGPRGRPHDFAGCGTRVPTAGRHR